MRVGLSAGLKDAQKAGLSAAGKVAMWAGEKVWTTAASTADQRAEPRAGH